MALRDFNRTMMLPMRVWDLPTRLFHWLIVVLLTVSFVSVKAGWMPLHLLSGYTVFTLLLFRIAWGFVGSETARFRSFLTAPAKGLLHLRRFGERTPDTQIGHNAAGGWMVLVMLVLLGVQVLSGLFNADPDSHAAGALAHHVSKGVSEAFGAVHSINFALLLLLIVLHILAIAAYRLVKHHDLVRPMITGVKRLPAATRQPRMANPLLAAVILGAALGIVWAVVSI
jgi:cytochrome b